MKKHKNSFPRMGDLGPWLLIAMVPMLLFLLSLQFHLIDQPDQIQPLMLLCIFLSGGYFCFVSRKSGDYTGRLIAFLLFLGFVMRIGYMLYTAWDVRAYDIGYLSAESHGHAPYIWNLFSRHQLPDTYSYQWYHPPFFHMAATIPIRITALAFPNAENETLLNAAKVVSCFASCGGLLLLKRICEELALKKTSFPVILGIAAFHPAFFQLAGRVNNDSLVLLFQMLILLYTIRWCQNPSLKHTVILAFAYGFGMMTKMSCASMAFLTAPLMLFVWIRRRGAPQFWQILGKGALFLVICCPLAFWYPVRNLLRFGQPLNYIPYIGNDHELYTGMYSAFQRFFSVPLGKLFQPLYCVPQEDYNVPLYLFKNSMFGEFSMNMADWLAKALVLTNILLILTSLACAVYVVVKGSRLHKLLRFGIPALWLIQLGSYFVFQLQFPFGCTMDFRYISITAFLGAIMTGCALQLFKEKNSAASRRLSVGITALVCLFASLSVAAYCTLS